jgi:hypothetical protein
MGRNRRAVVRWRPLGEEVAEVGFRLVGEARDEGVEIGVGLDLGSVDVELPPPDQPRLLAEINNRLEEPFEDRDPQPLPNPGQAGVVRQGFVEGLAQIPPVSEVQAGGLDELAFGADPLEKHDELQLEEDDRVNARSSSVGIQLPYPLPDEAQVQLCFQVAVEVVGRDERL